MMGLNRNLGLLILVDRDIVCSMPGDDDDNAPITQSSIVPSTSGVEYPSQRELSVALEEALINYSLDDMSPVPLRQELRGRLRNIGKLTNWFMAVAEAITNSLDAVQDSGSSGSIEVVLQRAESLLPEDPRSGPVLNVLIRDTGIGFTEANFESFCTADSLQKLERGGKGVGRLHCLQAFEEFHADSVFLENDEWKRRKFIFRRETPELIAALEETTERARRTDVLLVRLRSKFDVTAVARLNALSEWLAEHFLPALVEKPPWLQSLVIRDGDESLNLTDVVKGKSTWSVGFQLGGYEFNATCYALRGEGKMDQVRLVAARRVVYANTRELEFYLPHVSKISADNSHVILVTSSFFDEHVNDARNGVSFSEDSATDLLGVSAPDFRSKLGEALTTRLSERINQSVNELKSHVEKVVTEQAPHYRPLLLGYFQSKEFEALSRTARDEEILTSLDTFKRRDTGKLREESRRIAKMQTDTATYLESAQKLVGAIELQKKVALAEYIGLRKIVLERLEQLLSAKRDGKLHRDATDSATETQPYDRIELVERERALEDLATVSTDDLPHRQMTRYAARLRKKKRCI